jgi:hypothetical protein
MSFKVFGAYHVTRVVKGYLNLPAIRVTVDDVTSAFSGLAKAIALKRVHNLDRSNVFGGGRQLHTVTVTRGSENTITSVAGSVGMGS